MRTHTVRLPIYVAALVIATFAIGACGGGHGSTPGPKVLVSIAITPANPIVAAGLTEQLHATGTYSDGSSSDLTSSVIINWSSATQSVAAVDSKGFAIAFVAGTSVISAYSGSVLGTATLTVTPAVVKAIAVSPNPGYSGVGINLQLMAIGTYSNGATAVVSTGVAWTSSAPPVATINGTTGQITGQSLGITTITATVGSLVASAPLSIIALSWGATGSMATGRTGHTATLLANGKVLAAGGFADQGFGPPVASELFDAGSGTWSPTGALITPRSIHTATLLQNGMVLVTGGLSTLASNAFNSAELYNPATGTWSATGSLLTPRVYHTAVLLPDGTVLVAGGETSTFYNAGAVASTEIYDPVAATWRATGNLNIARIGHTATLLSNGKVLVAGGYGGSGQLASAEIYDPTTSTWTVTGSLTTAVGFQTATLLSNGKVLVAGGSITGTGGGAAVAAAELYDPNTAIWTSTGSLLTGAFNHTATLLPNGTVLFAGGDIGSTATAAAKIYDPTTGVWSATGSLGFAQSHHTATRLPNGTVLAAGGGSPSTASEIYFP
jgi:uncharacterized protein YjdB